MQKTKENDEFDAPTVSEAVALGEVLERSGYHQPGSDRFMQGCGCELTTEKGAYRDVVVEMPDGRVILFYHQSPVAVTAPDGRIRLDSHGFKAHAGQSGSPTTKERMNRALPGGYKIHQRDFVWYLSQPDGDEVEFHDGMVIDPSADEV